MTVLRAKTTNLFSYKNLTEKQKRNVNQNVSEMKTNEVVLSTVPQRLVLELTNSCNLSCIMCGRNAKEFKKTFFDLKWMDKLSTIMDKVTEVTLFGWGEPTVHPEFRQLLKILDEITVKTYFLTNGMLIDRFSDLILNTVDVMAVSIDGATPETNDRIRRGADFNKIIRHLKNLVRMRDKSPLKTPYINFVMTLMDDTIEELPRLVEIAHDVGIEEVKAVFLTAFSDDLAHKVLWDRKETVRRVFDVALEAAERYGILLKLPFIQGEDPAGDSPHKPCYVGWRDFFLGSDGFVRPCQSTAQKLFSIHDYEKFSEMWNGSEYREFRGKVNNLDLMPEQCRICYQSSHANWNRRSSFLQNEITHNFAPEWQK
ncbi:MAG: radical SAM protein [Desulfatitalea sp.]|nr:radical SAM protein [Desulfatitalea sp.]